MSDPTEHLYRIMDRAGLNAARLLTSKDPMVKTVNEIRTKMAKDIKEYIERREKRNGKS